MSYTYQIMKCLWLEYFKKLESNNNLLEKECNVLKKKVDEYEQILNVKVIYLKTINCEFCNKKVYYNHAKNYFFYECYDCNKIVCDDCGSFTKNYTSFECKICKNCNKFISE